MKPEIMYMTSSKLCNEGDFIENTLTSQKNQHKDSDVQKSIVANLSVTECVFLLDVFFVVDSLMFVSLNDLYSHINNISLYIVLISTYYTIIHIIFNPISVTLKC